MVFDQYFTGRPLSAIATECSFVDPSIASHAGYVQVVPTTGKGPVLLVVPEDFSFEAWRMLLEDPTQRGVTFEGWYQLMAWSRAWADREWAHAGAPWNPPTSHVVSPGTSVSVTLRLALAPSVNAVDDILYELGRPVVSAVPGYVLTPAMTGYATLGIRRRTACSVASIATTPAHALTFQEVHTCVYEQNTY